MSLKANSYILILLSTLFFTNCSPTKCNFNTGTCELTIKGEKYKIMMIELYNSKKQNIVYDLKKNKIGTNKFNFCNPDTSLYYLQDKSNSFNKNVSYNVTVIVGTDRDTSYIYHESQFRFVLDSANWSNKIIEGTWVTL